MSKLRFSLKKRISSTGISSSTVILAAVLFGQPAAADYVVQIGAWRSPRANYIEPARDIGPLLSQQTATGLTRYSVGPFTSHQDAKSAQRTLRQLGYRDAFIRSVSLDSMASATMPAASSRPRRISSPSLASQEPRLAIDYALYPGFSNLTPEQRANLVILDGEPHVKDGDEFRPLAQFAQ